MLEESVYSILQQTYQNWELLIINDCETQTIHFEHPQVRIFNQKTRFKTIAHKRNFGLDNANGDWIYNLDDDDFLLPEYLNTLKQSVGSSEWFSSQRPILYYDDPSKIILSPVPQNNTLLYSKKVAKEFYYDSTGSDELNPFYKTTFNKFNGTKRLMLIKPNLCGHVWRQDMNLNRKYSLASLIDKKIPQNKWNDALSKIEHQSGDIFLFPKWSKDYVSIIKKNMKIVSPEYVYSRLKGGTELFNLAKESVEIVQKYGPDELKKRAEAEMETPENSWEKVKPTWANALKFLDSIKSRGIVSTTLDAVGINKSMGERVSEMIFQDRKTSCFGNRSDGLAPCSRLKYVENRGYFCGGCGCGKNELARLDANSTDEYTKLHYPYLECPLKKKGFSNYSEEPTLSIIITCCNESDYFLNRTIESIRKTAGNRPEIIIVDDASTVPVKHRERVIRNDERMGVGRSRHKGATFASNQYLLFTDGHMIFDDNWYDNFIERVKVANSTDVFCGTCLGLDENDTDLSTNKGSYYGARLELYDEKENQILEGKWMPEQKEYEYEISCLMGALYFFKKEFFLKIRGLSDIKMWGSDEPLLSLKTLLCGGRIFILKNVRAGHVFRNAAPYVTNVNYLLYNKIRIAKTILPDDLGELLIDKIPRNENFYNAMNMINSEAETIEEYKKYYKSIFVKEFVSICNEYKIIKPK